MDKKKVAVIGLGYVGLPLACLCAERGYSVAGIDSSPDVVDALNRGETGIADPALRRRVSGLKGKILATAGFSEIKGSSAILICVPTPVDSSHRPDLSALRSASESAAPFVSRDSLVVIESTIYPGTTEEVVKPIIEKGSGLSAGRGFYLAHCPERIDPGNEEWPLEKIPRVLAALTPKGAARAREFYSSIISAEIKILNSVKAAEAVKVTENTFRDVNIAFVNELAKSFDAMGIDISEVIAGASTKPFGYMPFWPGPGVGGHCIAVDPYYLIEKAQEKGFSHEFLKLARKINDSMARYVEDEALQMLEKLGIKQDSAEIAFLGLAYKPGVSDTRESPALRIAEGLKARGIALRTYDPFVKEGSSASGLKEALNGADIAILATHHPALVKALSAKALKAAGVKGVVDARNSLPKKGIQSAGLLYKGIGR